MSNIIFYVYLGVSIILSLFIFKHIKKLKSYWFYYLIPLGVINEFISNIDSRTGIKATCIFAGLCMVCYVQTLFKIFDKKLYWWAIPISFALGVYEQYYSIYNMDFLYSKLIHGILFVSCMLGLKYLQSKNHIVNITLWSMGITGLFQLYFIQVRDWLMTSSHYKTVLNTNLIIYCLLMLLLIIVLWKMKRHPIDTPVATS